MDLDALNHAISVRDSGDQEGALAEFRSLIDKTEDPFERATLIGNEANILIVLHRFAEAKLSLKRARATAQDDSSEAHADYQEALLCIQEGRYSDALHFHERIFRKYPHIVRDPQNRYLYEALQADRGTVLCILGRAQEAIPILEEALTYEISDEKKGRAFYDLGFCYQGTKQDEKAEVAFEQARRLCKDPRVLVGARYSLGALYGKKGQWGKALQELEWCEEHFVNCDVPRDYVYGWLFKVLRAIGRPDEAERYRKLINASRVAHQR
jgi:tetratricopeptide (TPR) repeat protein